MSLADVIQSLVALLTAIALGVMVGFNVKSLRVARQESVTGAVIALTSVRLAINAKCYDCQGRDADPLLRWRIGNCESGICPLRPGRPYRHLAGAARGRAADDDCDDTAA